MNRVRRILLACILSSIFTVCSAQSPALNTCDGAYARLMDVDSVKCPPSTLSSSSANDPQKTAATCKTTTCAEALSAIDDSTLSQMKTGFTACGSLLEPQKSRATWAEAMNYVTVMSLATMCGHPASIVKLTPPALNTCDGATARYVAFMTQECPMSGPDTSAYPATCANDACKAAISAIDDSILASMKTGFTACTPGPNSYASTASSFNYQFLMMIATDCGHPASTVKLTPPTPPALNTCDGAYARYLVLVNACPSSETDWQRTPATCGNEACKAAITSIDDSTLSSIKTGFTAAACGYASLATFFNYLYLYSLATQCGHPLASVKVTPPALNTCDGAYARFTAIFGQCPTSGPDSSNTCGNTACATAISSIDDNTVSLMRTGFTACGNLPDSDGMKPYAVYATYFNYQYINTIARQCGLPASTVKLTPAALNTCDGAYARYLVLDDACPPTQGFNTAPRTPATCGNDACKAAITAIDDNTLSSMKTGFTTADCGYGGYAMSFNYVYLDSLATQCGHTASTVKVTPPALNTCDGAYARFAALLFNACPARSWPNSSATCGNTACATAISSIGDSTLSLMNTGFTACGNLPDSDTTGLKSFAVYATYFNYQSLNSLAIQCGHPTSIVKLTAPGLNTCDGAYARLASLWNACPVSGPNSSATCGNSVCATAISSIGGNTLSTMKTGFTACGNLPDSDPTGQKSLAVYATDFNYQYLSSLATQCGLSAGNVQLTSPGLNTCDGAYGRFETVGLACPAPYSQATCGGDACKTAVSSIKEDTLSSMKTGFTACGNLPDSDTTGRKSYSRYATYFNYQYLNNIATQCEHTANTVKLSPPDAQQLVKLSDSCDVAFAKYTKLDAMCPVSSSTPPACTFTTLESSAACQKTIIEFNDAFLWSMKGGLDSCSTLDLTDPRRSQQSKSNNFYERLYERATLCGFQDNVKLTPCSLCGRNLPLPQASEGTPLANFCRVNGQYIGSTGSAECKEGGNTYNTFSYTCGQWDKHLKTMWIDDPACVGKRSEKQSILLEAKPPRVGWIDNKFPDAPSKATQCNCPLPKEAQQTEVTAAAQGNTGLPPGPPLDTRPFVTITFSLGMRMADLTPDKQTRFKKSLQEAAGPGVWESDINIEYEPGRGRRLLAESIKVRSTIKVPSQAAADTMAKALTQDKINDALSKSGLPAATDVVVLASDTTAAPPSLADQIKSEATSAIIGGAIAGVVSLAGLLATYFRKWISSKCGCSEESDQNQEPLAEQKATTEASIVTCEVTVKASAAASTRALNENPV